jgi:hypothetical protein
LEEAVVAKVVAAGDTQVAKWTAWRNKLDDAVKFVDVVISEQDKVASMTKSSVDAAEAVAKTVPVQQ